MFLHRLALALGYTVEELEQRLSWQEFRQWQAFAAIEPFGDQRGDVQAGIIASTIANVNRSQSTKAFKPTDFMPFTKQRSPADPEYIKAILRGYK